MVSQRGGGYQKDEDDNGDDDDSDVNGGLNSSAESSDTGSDTGVNQNRQSGFDTAAATISMGWHVPGPRTSTDFKQALDPNPISTSTREQTAIPIANRGSTQASKSRTAHVATRNLHVVSDFFTTIQKLKQKVEGAITCICNEKTEKDKCICNTTSSYICQGAQPFYERG